MNKRINSILIALAVAFLFFSCKTTDPMSASYGTFEERVKSIPAKNFENYPSTLDNTLIERLREPPSVVLDWFKEMDGNPSYTAYLPDETERFIIDFALGNLPPAFRRILEERLLGIYFVNDFLGSGMTDYVLDEDNNLYFTLTFNPVVLSMSLTELVSYRENSCFIQDDPSISIEIQLSDEAPGFFYILLHETAHIADYVDRHTPYIEPEFVELFHYSKTPTPFTDGVWKNYYTLMGTNLFSYSDRISFYGMGGGPSIPVTEAIEVYRELEALPCASLYGTSSWAEDFAEMATFLYLVDDMQIDYRIALYQEGREIYSYEPFASSRVKERAALVKPLFY